MIYTYAFTSRKCPFFDDHSFFHAFFLSLSLSPFLSFFLFLSFTHSLTLSLSLSLTLSLSFSFALHYFTHAFDSRVLIQLIASLAIAPRLRTPWLLSLLHSRSCKSSHLRFAAIVTFSEAALDRPREQTHRFFVVISINKEIPIQGRTLAYPMR